jgi:hypothetical protein
VETAVVLVAQDYEIVIVGRADGVGDDVMGVAA